MSSDLPPIILKPVGIVKSDVKKPVSERQNLSEIVSEIVIDEYLTEALDGIEGFSHVIVLYWLDRASSEQLPLKVHPMGNKEVQRQGIFAVRTPNRPNRIAKTTVRLISRQANILKVEGLDALDGSLVIDIKPFIPGYDSPENARVPTWIRK